MEDNPHTCIAANKFLHEVEVLHGELVSIMEEFHVLLDDVGHVQVDWLNRTRSYV